ncbi:MAG: hypothetical protein PHC60_03095 [Heliobacteriaceae bacterium]|nr:hypothetical protein [Heliobacteriaceae bacterium]MDD4587366.1 hypothetical protein [Heliobacteriaceae bacterium]
MKLFIWRHNRRFHSYSMIDEPCVVPDLYTDAVAVVLAETEEQALAILAAREPRWRVADLKRLQPRVIDLTTPGVLFTFVGGN